MIPTTLTDSNGTTVRVYGMQNLDVGLIEYVDSSSFVVGLESSDGTTITNLTYAYLNYEINPSVSESNLSDGDRPVIIEIYEDSSLTTRVYSNLVYAHPYTGSIALNTTSNHVWCRITLKKINNSTPVIKELTVKYN